MKKISIWEDSIKLKSFNKLNHNLTTDILIIGGGITGISTLFHLNNSKYKVSLVEQNKIGMSTTSKSTGKLTYLQNNLLYNIKKTHGESTLINYINSQKDAIKMIIDTIKKLNIDCELEKVSSEVYTNKESEISKLKELEELLNKNNIKITSSKNNIIDNKYIIKVNDTYIYNPLKFINGLINNIDNNNIYENTSIIKITKENNNYICLTNNNKKIITKYIVLSSHYPYFNIPYLFPIKGYIEKSYLSASIYKHKNNISLISYSNPFISLRTYKDYLVYLSNSHSTNKNINDNKNYQELIKKLNKINLTPEYLWSNSDIITNDYLPYIGILKDNILIATGYNTWGLASGYLAGLIVKDIINNKNNKYIDLFNPNRVNINILKPLSNTYKNISSIIKSYTKKPKIKCPHMGCNLIYNDVEDTWDCPCHGSRFNKDGKCIASPSNKDINIK